MLNLNQIISEAKLPSASLQSIRGLTDAALDQHKSLAFHLASASLQKNKGINISRETFATEYSDAWTEAFYNIANYEKFSNNFLLPKNDHLLVCGWHFPELFKYLNLVTKYNILFLVSQDANWFNTFKQSGNTLNFNIHGATTQLSKVMQNGRSIFCMLDHVYQGTTTLETTFLNGTISIPSGIFQLAVLNNYELIFLGPENGQITIKDIINAGNKSVQDLVNWYGSLLVHEVLKTSSRWLMWPNASIKFSLLK